MPVGPGRRAESTRQRRRAGAGTGEQLTAAERDRAGSGGGSATGPCRHGAHAIPRGRRKSKSRGVGGRGARAEERPSQLVEMATSPAPATATVAPVTAPSPSRPTHRAPPMPAGRGQRVAPAQRHDPVSAAGDLSSAEGQLRLELHAGRADDAGADADRLGAAAGGRIPHRLAAQRRTRWSSAWVSRWSDCCCWRRRGAIRCCSWPRRWSGVGSSNLPPRVVAGRADGLGRATRPGAVGLPGRRQRRIRASVRCSPPSWWPPTVSGASPGAALGGPGRHAAHLPHRPVAARAPPRNGEGPRRQTRGSSRANRHAAAAGGDRAGHPHGC